MSDRDSFGWRRERRMVVNIPPTVEMVHDLFLNDAVDLLEFERLLEFAPTGRVVPDPPPALEFALYERQQYSVRFSGEPMRHRRVQSLYD